MPAGPAGNAEGSTLWVGSSLGSPPDAAHVYLSPPLHPLRDLQDVKSLEAQLDAQQDIAAQLSAELEEKAAELAEVS